MKETRNRDENRSLEQPKKKKTALEVLEDYKNGKREFHDLDLSSESFAECNLSGADFTHCTLTETNFTHCTLTETNFTHCTLTGTNFRKARLQKAKFHNVDARSENSQIEYTLFFILLLFVTAATIFAISLLVNSSRVERTPPAVRSALYSPFLLPFGSRVSQDLTMHC